jgi:hypothetical protein
MKLQLVGDNSHRAKRVGQNFLTSSNQTLENCGWRRIRDSGPSEVLFSTPMPYSFIVAPLPFVNVAGK